MEFLRMALLTGRLVFTYVLVTLLMFSLLTPFSGSISLLRPDVRSLLLCPVCENLAQPDNHYWMLFYPLFQLIPPPTFVVGMRLTPRLTCGSCMESLVQGVSLKNRFGESRTIMGLLEELPNASFLYFEDSQLLSKLTNADLSAWDLYIFWVNSGAWKVNETAYKELAQSIFGKKNEAKKQAGSTCCTCSNQMLPDNVMRCSRCKKAAYCNRECQKKDWPRHKLQCTPSPQNR